MFAMNLLHIVDEEVCATVLDLLLLMRGADGDDSCTRSNTRTNARRRVLEDNTILGIVAELIGSERRGGRDRGKACRFSGACRLL